jgi:RNA polymerase sigma factor (sigma-70 family)
VTDKFEEQFGMADVAAARAGDHRALDALVAEYLPLIYNIVGRALESPADVDDVDDVDDVVQDVMVEMVRDLHQLRDPAALRSWLVAIAMRQVRRHWRLRRTAPARAATADAELTADPGADFVDLTISALHLSGQRREVAQATRWLEPDGRELLSLWWLETAGQLTRSDLAAALGLTAAQAALRVQRMKAQLETARIVVRAVQATNGRTSVSRCCCGAGRSWASAGRCITSRRATATPARHRSRPI